MSYLGRPGRPWFVASLNGNQSTSIANANHIEFNASFGFGGITVSTGVGQAKGIITLPTGFLYLCRIYPGVTMNEATMDARLVYHPSDVAVTNPNGVGSGIMRFADTNSVTVTAPTPSSTVIVDCTGGSQQVKVERISGGTQLLWFNATRIFIEALR